MNARFLAGNQEDKICSLWFIIAYFYRPNHTQRNNKVVERFTGLRKKMEQIHTYIPLVNRCLQY